MPLPRSSGTTLGKCAYSVCNSVSLSVKWGYEELPCERDVLRMTCLNADEACGTELLCCRFIALMASIRILSVYSLLQCGFAGTPVSNTSLFLHSLSLSQLVSLASRSDSGPVQSLGPQRSYSLLLCWIPGSARRTSPG